MLLKHEQMMREQNIERRKNGEGNRHSRLGAIKVSIGVNKYALLVYVNMTQNVLCTGLYVFNSYNLAHRVPGDTHRGFIFSGKKLLLQLVKCKLFLTNILPLFLINFKATLIAFLHFNELITDLSLTLIFSKI